jgi:serine protease Do
MLSALAFCPSAVAEESVWIDGASKEAVVPELNLPSFAPAIEKMGEAVVNIQTEGKESKANPQAPQQQQTPFDFFFHGKPQQARPSASLGSGFVIHPDGYIVTNHHVVENAGKINVSFRGDKKTYLAELVGSDPKTDIALIKVKRDVELAAAPLGDSDAILPGDWVIAIGNPFRLGHTATVGIVSAKHRRIPGGKPYDSFIQTDASINPGNSGGPLFDAKGHVIGVNTAIYSPGRMGMSGYNIGIGFAIPINLVKNIVTQLAEKGEVTRGWLGVLIQSVSPDHAEALKLKEARGALVADVIPGSPAKQAGFRRGDVIVKFDGQRVEDNDDLPLMVAETAVGKTVSVEVIRNRKRKVLSVDIKELTEEQEVEIPSDVPSEEERLGLTVQEITPDIARSLGISNPEGVIVTDVLPNSPAAKAGMRRGDVLLEFDSQSITSSKRFRELVDAKKKDAPMLVLVRRNNNTIFLTIRVEK